MRYFKSVLVATVSYVMIQSAASAGQLVGVSCDNIESATTTAISWSQSRSVGYEFNLDLMAPLPGCEFIDISYLKRQPELTAGYTIDFAGASTDVEGVASVYPVHVLFTQARDQYMVLPGDELGLLM